MEDTLGKISIDIRKDSNEWGNIVLTDVDTIKGLIKFRSKFDVMYNLNSSIPINVDIIDASQFSEEILCLYITLDQLINKCNFNQNQTEVLKLYMDGYIEDDIAEILNTSQQNIFGIINSICKKIKKENDDSRYIDNITWNYIVPENGFKQCSKCGEILPAEKRFFGKDERILDGFKSYCKKCDANTKKI